MNASCASIPPEILKANRSVGACACVALIANRPPPSNESSRGVRSNWPNWIETEFPTISLGVLVITFTTPVSAFDPHTADAGPRMTSICFIWAASTGMKSHMTNPKKSW